MTGEWLLFILFLGLALVLWLSLFGYLLTLAYVAYRRPRNEQDISTFPEIAIVIPVLNEEDLILIKLAELWSTDYPHDRMVVVVVDGGSVDQTTELVRQEIARGEPIKLVSVNETRGRTDQIIHAMGLLTQNVVVVTDVDSVLEPSCIRELVNSLEQDPQTAIIGATVRPNTALLEERIHWWFINYLWWLEGEVLSSAGVSGVCYACRREVVLTLARDAQAEYMRLPFLTSARGYRVRICPTARVTEVRVPQTKSELVRFRRRRGGLYVSELRSSSSYANAVLSWRLTRLMRLWHFLVAPKVGAVLAICAFVLVWTSYWPWLLLTFISFASPLFAILFALTTEEGDGRRWWRFRLSLAGGRLFFLNFVSLLRLNSHLTERDSLGAGS